jgi:uncharacterized membrane protein
MDKNTLQIFWAFFWRWILLGWGGSIVAALMIGVVMAILGFPQGAIYNIGYILGFFGWVVASPMMFNYVLRKKRFKNFSIEIVPRTDSR